MIPFTNSELHLDDGSMYFNGCTGFLFDKHIGKVAPFELCCEDWCPEYEDEECPLFVEIDHLLRFDCFGDNSPEYVSGNALLSDPEYMLSRFPLGYVPIGKTRLVRATAQPLSRRAAKGLLEDFVQYHPIVELTDRRESLVRRVINSPVGPCWQDFCNGIAEVLTIGMPNVMRRNMNIEAARLNARRAVLRMFRESDRTVCVPDFSMALVQKRGSSDVAYLLYRGRLLGEVRAEPDNSITYTGYLRGKKGGTRGLIKEAQEEMTIKMFADRVRWSNK